MNNKKTDPLKIYWAPYSSPENEQTGEWNMLFDDPKNLFSELMQNRNKNDKSKLSFFSCPAASGRMKHSYVFKSPIDIEYEYDFTDIENMILKPLNEYPLNVNVFRPSAFENGASLSFQLKWLFFAEEETLGVFSPPMMHKPKFTQYGTTIPGSFDISSWFRPYVLEIQMWESKGILKIEAGEPLFYFEVLTDRPIELYRFKCNNALIKYSESCVNAPKYFGKLLPLTKRYDRFKNTSMHKLVLKEIKNNLVN